MDKKKKVLFLTNIPSPYRIDFFNELGKYCDLTVTFEGLKATDRNENWIGEKVKNFNAIYLKGIRTGSDNFLCFDVIRELKKDWDAIIVGVYSTPTSMLAIEFMKNHHIDFIIQSDGGFIKDDNALKRMIKKHFISPAKIWLSTADMTTDYLVHYGAERNRCFKYPFTSVKYEDIVAADTMVPKKDLYRKKLQIKEDKVIISVGRFSYHNGYGKGYDILMKCAESLNNDFGIYIIGEEPTPEFVEWKKNKGLDNVHFIGFKSKQELQEYYAAADLFVLMTREDIWGLVINEAMAFSLPVITTDKCIAGLEMVKDDKNGYIVTSEDVEGLRRRIERVFRDKETVEVFRKQSRKIAENFTIETMAKKHMEILEKYNEKY